MKLEAYLARKGMKQAEFARALGVSEMAVSRYVRGRVPEPEIMARIIVVTKKKVRPNDFYE